MYIQYSKWETAGLFGNFNTWSERVYSQELNSTADIFKSKLQQSKSHQTRIIHAGKVSIHDTRWELKLSGQTGAIG